MKKSIILIKKNFFILEGKEYDFDKIDEISYFLKANVKMIILEEELYVKRFINKLKKSKLSEFVDYKINNDFPQNGDILYDYNFKKKNNVISIYSIRGAKRIEKLCKTAKNIEVKPIQFIIKEIMIKYLKNKNFTAEILTKFLDVFYYISFKEGFFDYGFVENNKELLLDKIFKNSEHERIFVDNDIIDILSAENKISPIKINIGELINEKIYEKQRFYSRKVL